MGQKHIDDDVVKSDNGSDTSRFEQRVKKGEGAQGGFLKCEEPGLPETPDVCRSRVTAATVKDDDLDTWAHMFEQEGALGSCSSYLDTTQSGTGITAGHRASVIDTLITAAAALNLHTDSLFTAVACLDRYLAIEATPQDLLQAVGIACLWLAAKYEQLVVPSATSFAQFVLLPESAQFDGPAAVQRLLVVLEGQVLQALDYKLASFVTMKAFNRRTMLLVAGLQQQEAASAVGRSAAAGDAAVQAAKGQQQYSRLYYTTSYLAEICLLEYQLLPYSPSQLAAAAFHFAHILLGLQLDHQLMWQLTNHSLGEVKAPMQWLCALHATLCTARGFGRPYGVSVKYDNPQLGAVASVVAPITNPLDPRLSLASGCKV